VLDEDVVALPADPELPVMVQVQAPHDHAGAGADPVAVIGPDLSHASAV
jgi:hypothetical protein